MTGGHLGICPEREKKGFLGLADSFAVDSELLRALVLCGGGGKVSRWRAPPPQKSVPHNPNLQALSQATINKWIDLIPQIFKN